MAVNLIAISSIGLQHLSYHYSVHHPQYLIILILGQLYSVIYIIKSLTLSTRSDLKSR